jgi:hypothetical protein
MVGFIQVIISIPLRIISLNKSRNIKEFQIKENNMLISSEESFLVRKKSKLKQDGAMYHMFEFVFQIVCYLSIGRLYLSDFFTRQINAFNGLNIAIPTIAVTSSRDLGGTVLAIVIIIILISAYMVWKIKKKLVVPIALLSIVAYALISHFPTALEMTIHAIDLTVPSHDLLTLTSIITFISIVLLDGQTITAKSKLARSAGIDEHVIKHTEEQLVGDTLRSAILVALGIQFFTSQIPGTFHLTILTIGLVSLLSPLTIDKWILNRTYQHK